MIEISKAGVFSVVCIAALVAAPDPAAPWALSSALAVSEVLGRLTGLVVAAVWDRRSVTSLGSSGAAADIGETIAELRTRIRAITAALEADCFDEHLDVGRRIEPALMWLDAVELGAPELCQGDKRRAAGL
jgi:hypothetical protein